ncbi:MAG: DUF402 domain-containing protein [Candidatus Limivivens sp.]|nr:DUF402 domain-containing protein [Candidatus Limivivens sp.]
MDKPVIFRKRLIPEECVLLKDDALLYRDKEIIVTAWNTLKPKKNLHHGLSCYFLERGWKVSKFYDHSGSLISWYCDIVDYQYDEPTDTYVVTDLLADVIVYPDGSVRVVDLDELAQALDSGILSPELLKKALRRLDRLLGLIYKGDFPALQSCINDREPSHYTSI